MDTALAGRKVTVPSAFGEAFQRFVLWRSFDRLRQLRKRLSLSCQLMLCPRAATMAEPQDLDTHEIHNFEAVDTWVVLIMRPFRGAVTLVCMQSLLAGMFGSAHVLEQH